MNYLSHFLQVFSVNIPSIRMKMREKSNYLSSSLQKCVSKIVKRELPKPMGRWNIDYCNTKTNQKVDLSNEDHCGPCGQYAITKMKPVDKNITKTK